MTDSSASSSGEPPVVPDADLLNEVEGLDELDDIDEGPPVRLGAPVRAVVPEPDLDDEVDDVHEPDTPPEPEPRAIAPRQYIPAPGPTGPPQAAAPAAPAPPAPPAPPAASAAAAPPPAAPPGLPPLPPPPAGPAGSVPPAAPTGTPPPPPPAPAPPAPPPPPAPATPTPPTASTTPTAPSASSPPMPAGSPAPPAAPVPPPPTPPTPGTPVPPLGAPIGGATAPTPPPDTDWSPGAADQDLDELLDRFHDEHGLEPTEWKGVGDELTDARDLERPDGPKIVVGMQGGLDFHPSFARLPARIVGWLVDTLIVNLFMAPGIAIAVVGSSTLWIVLGAMVAVVGLAAAITLQARAVARSGRWIGNRIMKTKVVRAHNGTNLDIGAAATRATLRHVVSPIFMFGYVPALFDGQRRTFHDRFASSVVITRPREVWTPDEGAHRG